MKKVFRGTINWVEVGDRMRRVAKSQNIKVEELAARIGIHEKTLYPHMSGKKVVSADLLLAFSLALPKPVSLHWLLTDEGPKTIAELKIAEGQPVELPDEEEIKLRGIEEYLAQQVGVQVKRRRSLGIKKKLGKIA